MNDSSQNEKSLEKTKVYIDGEVRYSKSLNCNDLPDDWIKMDHEAKDDWVREWTEEQLINPFDVVEE